MPGIEGKNPQLLSRNLHASGAETEMLIHGDCRSCAKVTGGGCGGQGRPPEGDF